MTSPSLLDRFTSPRNRSPILPFHKSPLRSPNEYDLDELEPRPDETLNNDDFPRPRLRKSGQASNQSQSQNHFSSSPGFGPASPSFADSRASSSDSPSRTRSKVMFAGPPPPIASSRFISSHRSSQSPGPRHGESSQSQGLLASGFNLGGSFFEQRQQQIVHKPDSIWRGLQRREKALQKEVQQLLDLQAAGLVAGCEHGVAEKDVDATSDGDASSGYSTFYSTATSKSRMVNSLHIPTRSTPDGNVIPVRQPKARKQIGIKPARAGLRRAMAALLELKEEEDAYVQAALAQRRDALKYLNRMSSRKDKIYTQLHELEDDLEEPLGKEFRELESDHNELTQEIRELEEKLIGMRNRRRWIREKMDDVKNRREAGLSGYRNAKRDIDAEVQTLLHRPPITPLDLDALRQYGQLDGAGDVESPGGIEFLRLRPERRTAQMAGTWWEEEITVLERRKAQILTDRQALDQGSALWAEVTKLVSDFESSLRASANANGNKRENAQVDWAQKALRTQLEDVESIVTELEHRLQIAEEKHWNLLICAIGAELDAFLQARKLLSERLDILDEEARSDGGSTRNTTQSDDQANNNEDQDHEHYEESDNEVPPGLLVSHIEDQERPGSTSPQRSVVLRRQNSNEVPPEFLAEHESKVD